MNPPQKCSDPLHCLLCIDHVSVEGTGGAKEFLWLTCGVTAACTVGQQIWMPCLRVITLTLLEKIEKDVTDETPDHWKVQEGSTKPSQAEERTVLGIGFPNTMGPLEACAFSVLGLAILLLARSFHQDPLSCFPGPPLAKWTWLYRAYYDIVVGGGWLSHLQALHETYGPVVRVGRNELHFADPSAYADIYNSPYKLPKDPSLYHHTFNFGLPLNIFSMTNPKDHSATKSLFSSYFSRKGILRLEGVIQERVDKLILQLIKNHKTSPASMNHAFRAVTLDVITRYTLRTSLDTTSFPSFHHPAILAVDARISQLWISKHFPIFKWSVGSLPRWLVVRVSRTARSALEMRAEMEKLVDKAILDSLQISEKEDSDSDPNVFYTLLRNAQVEGLRIAGSDTVGNACTVGARCLVRDERVRTKLVQELEAAWPDKDTPMPLERLEKLPYLTAVIKESLRLSHGVVTPMTRVVSDSGAVIAGRPVPPGTIVSIGNSFVHMNADIFPDPARFYPERWLEDRDHLLDRYLVSFGKGLRACLGINLAWSELYMILGNVFRKLDFQSRSDLWSEMKIMEYFLALYEGDVLDVTVSERE
uniref:Benzoate 4-monooxygenase cytochrome p450 n=1 Tax=Moniliophthora roreri TaxID=221103 RepID=A0A0W0FAH8_MONRR